MGRRHPWRLNDEEVAVAPKVAGPCSDNPGQGLITAIAGYVGVEVRPWRRGGGLGSRS